MQNIITNFLGYKKVFSIFPELYNYRELAPLILRCSIGIIFFFSGVTQLYKKNGTKLFNISFGIFKIATGVFLTVGLYSQIFALIGIIISIFNIILNIKNSDGIDAVVYNSLIIIIAFSLLLTGPGVLAFDLPL